MVGQNFLYQSLQAVINAINAKLGSGVSAAVANTALLGTGTGTSAWGAITGAYIQAATITLNKLSAEAWTTFTPLLAQGGAVASTVNIGKYVRIGNTVHVRVKVTATAGGVAGNAIQIYNLPILMADGVSSSVVGSGMIINAVAGYHYPCVVVPVSNGAVQFFTSVDTGTGTPYSNYAGIAPAATLANTWIVALDITYEAA